MTNVDSGIAKGDLTDINRSFEERDTQKNAQSLGIPYIDIAQYPLNTDILKMLDPQESKQGKILFFDRVKHKLKIALVDTKNPKAQKIIQETKQSGRQIELYLCSPSGFDTAYQAYDADFFKKKKIELREDLDETKQKAHFSPKEFERIQKELAQIPSSQALNEIKLLALQYNASDIHLQPVDDHMVVRFRIDGILHEIFTFDLEVAKGLVTRIKYESHMKANITDTPQDGHTVVKINQREVDLRVSSLPTPTIESIVIRILDSSRGIMTFEDLGFSEKNTKKILQTLRKKTGMTLVTGPTGSGKTTTLYSMLAQLNTPDKKLVTLEDPIEYHLDGITQSEVSENQSYNFETGLKALVRHDPDVILVGEIRSYQTAKLAVEASLTGHVVLSSLHTNSALGAIDRLRNLGLEDYNIAPGINALFAQRLVRRVCPHCSKKTSLPTNNVRINKTLDKIHTISPNIKDASVQAQGCEKCAGIGYQGQVAITEAVILDDTIRQMILDGKNTLEIKKYIEEQTDFTSLFEEGLVKVMNGVTTLEELYRVVG